MALQMEGAHAPEKVGCQGAKSSSTSSNLLLSPVRLSRSSARMPEARLPQMPTEAAANTAVPPRCLPPASQTDRQTNRQTDSQPDRQPARQAGRQTRRQRQTDRQTGPNGTRQDQTRPERERDVEKRQTVRAVKRLPAYKYHWLH